MLTLPPSTRIFVALQPADMRGSFSALAGQVRRLHRDPVDGHLYFFVNRRRTLMKVLWFDRTGFCLWSKKLERGTFELPAAPDDATQVQISPVQLQMILEGVVLSAPRRLRYQASSQAR